MEGDNESLFPAGIRVIAMVRQPEKKNSKQD
jgi:hypothetical protein